MVVFCYWKKDGSTLERPLKFIILDVFISNSKPKASSFINYPKNMISWKKKQLNDLECINYIKLLCAIKLLIFFDCFQELLFPILQNADALLYIIIIN